MLDKVVFDRVVDQLLVFLEQSGKNRPAFDDDIFSRLIDLLDKGQLDTVQRDCGDLLMSGCSDIRLITLYLYSSMSWMSVQVGSLFPLLQRLLTKNIEQLLPEDMTTQNKLIELDLALDWFFRKINRKVVFYQQTNPPKWSEWIEQLNRKSLDELEVHASEFRQLINELLSDTPLKSLVGFEQFKQFFAGISVAEPQHLVDSEKGPTNSEHQDDEHPENERAEVELTEDTPAIEISPNVTSAQIQENPMFAQEQLLSPEQTLNPTPNMPIVSTGTYSENPSHALSLLLKKLELFRLLLDRDDYMKASIIASDVTQIMEQFDPKQYFPALFTPFIKSQIQHSQALQEVMYQTDQAALQPYMNLYQGDLDAFMEIKTNY